MGTVYRRFGDLTGLARSLLDDRERQFQQAFMHGPPPLGPGSSPRARISAFLHALVDQLDEQPELLLLAEATTPTVHFSTGSYLLRHAHLVTLLRQFRPSANAHFLAHALLASVSASLIVYQRGEEGLDVDEIKSNIDDLLQLITDTETPRPGPSTMQDSRLSGIVEP